MEVLHILVRVSTQVQEDDGTSLKTQQEQGIELSKKWGMKYQIHNEGGTSSSKDTLDNRPVMLNLLKLMDEGVVKHLYVYNTDRISRNQSYYLTMEVRITSSNLWLSHYSDYQMELYSIISDLHDNHNMTFKQISDYLIEKGYKTPRGCLFSHRHTWSIYTKKNRSDQRNRISS
jgi:hypothetical protein